MRRSVRIEALGLIAISWTIGCSRDIEDGVFSPLGPYNGSATTVSGGNDESTGGDAGSSTTDDAPDTAKPASGTSAEGSSGDPTADPTTDPTVDPTNDPTVDPGSSSGVDPTGVDPTGVDPTGADDACCSTSLSPGCTDAVTEACVCGLDDYCCSTEWDATCVSEAADCGAPCMGGGGGGDCCQAVGNIGCSDATIESCVCSFDDYCCSFEWDDTCVGEAVDCGAAC